jgi:hypothetical protein
MFRAPGAVPGPGTDAGQGLALRGRVMQYEHIFDQLAVKTGAPILNVRRGLVEDTGISHKVGCVRRGSLDDSGGRGVTLW